MNYVPWPKGKHGIHCARRVVRTEETPELPVKGEGVGLASLQQGGASVSK